MHRVSSDSGSGNLTSKRSQGRLVNVWQQRIHDHRQSTTVEVISPEQPTDVASAKGPFQQKLHLFQQPTEAKRSNEHSSELLAPEDDPNRLSTLPSAKPSEAPKSPLILPHRLIDCSLASEVETLRSTDDHAHQNYAAAPTTENLRQKSKQSSIMKPEDQPNCTERIGFQPLNAVPDQASQKDESHAYGNPRTSPDPSAQANLESMARPVSSNHERRREDRAQGKPIPVSHISALQAVYGDQVNLYRDVLKVRPNATERQIRIAYFREGRMILTGQELSPASKRRFEAISVAYEILSQWRETYDTSDGDWSKLLALSPVAVAETEPLLSHRTPAQAVSSSAPPSEKVGDKKPSVVSKRRGIHWNENVEELLYEKDPKEANLKQDHLSPEHLSSSENVYLEKQAFEKLQQHQKYVTAKRKPKRQQSDDSEKASRPDKLENSQRSTGTAVNAIDLAKHLRSFDSGIVNNFLDREAFEESLGGFFECLSHDENPHKDENRTPKKSNTVNHCHEDAILDLYASLEEENVVSPKGVGAPSPPKDEEIEAITRNLFKEPLPIMTGTTSGLEQNGIPFDELPKSQREHSSRSESCRIKRKDDSVFLAFSDDPFAGLNIPVLASLDLPPEFRPWIPSEANAPNTLLSGTHPPINVAECNKANSKVSVVQKLLEGLPAVVEKAPLPIKHSSQEFFQGHLQMTASNPLHAGHNQVHGSSTPRKAVDKAMGTGIPVGTVDLKRFRSNVSTNSGITFEDTATANESTPVSPFCDDAFLDHVSVYFKQLGNDMTKFSNRVNTEVNKLGATMGTAISQQSQIASAGIGDIGKSMTQNWEQANQVIISSIQSMTDEEGKDIQIRTAPTV